MAQELRTVLLKHDAPAGVHYDWMLEPPGTGLQRLWTCRVYWPVAQWPTKGTWEVEVIAPHRRDFLDYQGPLTHGRGTVSRIERGLYTQLTWLDDRLELDLTFSCWSHHIHLEQIDGARWQAAINNY